MAEGAVKPDRKGFKFLAGGFAGIKLSRFTSEAPVGPRKASGVRHVRGLGAARLSPRCDRSNISGLPSLCPFICPPSMASSNRSPSEGLPVLRKGSVRVVLSDGAENRSTPEEAALAGKAQSRPVALLCGSAQGSRGGSHGGGGLLEVGGAIQGGSALEAFVLPSRESQGSVPPA